MKVILYMEISANGMIATKNDDTSFISENAWKCFDEMTRKAGNIIVGKRTFDRDVKDGNFPYPDRLNVVMTNKKIKNKWGDNVIFTDKSPKEVLKLLEEKRFKIAFVGGGGKINASFLKENLVDEVYFDVEPVLIGNGIKISADEDFEIKMKLLETKIISEDEFQLHYKVLKN
ncbi:MAG: dihydrofolate reductase [Candidatus Aenigmatarchaeota archaeon]